MNNNEIKGYWFKFKVLKFILVLFNCVEMFYGILNDL